MDCKCKREKWCSIGCDCECHTPYDLREALRALLEGPCASVHTACTQHGNDAGECLGALQAAARAALAAPVPTTETRKKTPRLEWHPGGTARVGWLEIQKWVPAGGERWAIRIDGFATEAEAKSAAESAARGTR